MIKSLVLSFLILSSSYIFASDSEDGAINYLASKTIEDFQKGINLYNETKSQDAPLITKSDIGLYKFKVKANTVEFSLVNYLNDQIYINGHITQKSGFGLNKTTWNLFLINSAYAQENPTLDADSTRIILTALGSVSGKLDDIGMFCVFGCVKDTREKNLKKIMVALEKENASCQEGSFAQTETIEKFPSYKMLTLLHSVVNPEFQGVKNFFQKVAEANLKASAKFMDDKLAIDKKQKNCMAIMTADTVADGTFDNLGRGWAVLKGGGPGTVQMQSAIENAKNTCLKMEELKSCLNSVKNNLASINGIKRAEKRKDPRNSVPEEKLPDTTHLLGR
ncbi:MAG: hypothetical protein K2Q18_17935 [Bdellovibrionales bacterium]|nr:hypothetical protein [Bdellovibrionales bacterium]